MPLNTPRKTVKSRVASTAVVQPPARPLPAREEIHPMSSPAKPKPATAPMVFTANRLRDGRVVWLAGAGNWVDEVTGARIFPPAEAAEGQALAHQGERAQHVVGAYGVEVALQAGRPVPVKFRERLR